MGKYIRDSEEQKKNNALEDSYKTLDKYELLKLALTDKTICIDNVEKLVSLSSDHSRSAHILKQILAELAREERQPLARKGQMRRTGRNQ